MMKDIRKKPGRALFSFLVAVFVLAFLFGCAQMQRWVQDNPKTVLGIGAGAATGGLAGGIIGHQVGHTAGGLLIGSGIGGVAGGLIGSAVEDRGAVMGHSSFTPSTHSSPPPYARYNPAVADVQRSLKNMGYDCGPVDGVMGPRTRQAIMNFQRNQGLTADGVAGPVTRARLIQMQANTAGYKEL